MADVASTLAAWLSTTASNAPSGATTIGTGLDDNLRELQGVVVRGLSHKGSDIASATTTDIGAVEGLMHDITGTTTITGLGTVRAGILKFLKFEGVLTLTHNATSLILPGAANITTADGDVGIFISEGSGNWRCLAYQRANGMSVYGLVQIERKTASNSATVDFTLPSGYDFHILEVIDAAPQTDGATPGIRFSDDNGATFEADAADYAYTSTGGTSSTGESSSGDTEIQLNGTGGVGNASGERVSMSIRIYGALNAALFTTISATGVSISAAGIPVNITSAGMMNTASSDEAVRFLFSSGNVVSGTFVLYGMRSS